MIAPFFLPWPVESGHDLPDDALEFGDNVEIRHIARKDRAMRAVVVGRTTRGRSVELVTEEPVTSPANWLIVAVL